MFDSVLLFCQTLATAMLGAWMFSAVKDNWLLPRLNADIVGMILRIDKFEQLHPDDFSHVAHRRVTSEVLHRLIFRAIFLWESLACLLLLLGALGLSLALLGGLEVDKARALALLGALAFTANWAGFLTFGNHWVYWYCHEWGQNSHFQLLLWGLGTMIFLGLTPG